MRFTPVRFALFYTCSPIIRNCTPTPFLCMVHGQPGLEGLRRRHDLQPGHLAGSAGEHRAVPQRRAAHAGGPAPDFGHPHQRRLHGGAHLPADLHRGVHHRPHGPPVCRGGRREAGCINDTSSSHTAGGCVVFLLVKRGHLTVNFQTVSPVFSRKGPSYSGHYHQSQ